MRKYMKYILAFALFIIIFLFQTFLYHPRGIEIAKWQVATWDTMNDSDSFIAPFNYGVTKSGIYYLSSQFDENMELYDSIYIQKPLGYAFEVYFNEVMIYSQGDMDYPTANLWNTSYLITIPEALKQKENSIEMKVYALHDVGFISIPSLVLKDDIHWVNLLQNIYTNFFNDICIGICIFLGIILLLFSKHNYTHKISYQLLAMAAFFYAIHSLDYSYRLFTGSLTSYFIFRKIIISSFVIALYLLIYGLNTYFYNVRLPKYVHILFILSLMPIYAAQNYICLNNIKIYYYIFALIGIIFLIIEVYVRRITQLQFSISFLSLTLIHNFILFIFNIAEPAFFNIGIFVLLIGITYSLIMEYSEIAQKNNFLSHKVITDSLTNAYNREFINSVQCTPGDIIMFIDLDNFKKYNDAYGHQAGDTLLISFTNYAKKLLQCEDYFIRYGGDEFIIIKKDATPETGSTITRELDEFAHSINEFGGISYGVFPYEQSIFNTMQEADKQMYQMKAGKKDKK
ncbi:GGDEF domain-containing protein [Clostridium sp. DL1XJH146]